MQPGPTPNCPKCGHTAFMRKIIEPEMQAERVEVLCCSKCGAIVCGVYPLDREMSTLVLENLYQTVVPSQQR
jgi:hypothetical protein